MTSTPCLRRLALVAASLLAIGAAQAANFSSTVYAGAKDDIKSTYKFEREACNTMAGNAKDICVESAKGHEKVALAQLEYNQSGKAADEAKVYQSQYEADYAVAKEKCDDLGGNAKDVCVREAKTNRDKSQADLKLAKRVSAAADTAVQAHMQADYKLAKEKCDALAGDAKDICVVSARARFREH